MDIVTYGHTDIHIVMLTLTMFYLGYKTLYDSKYVDQNKVKCYLH